MRVGLDWIGLDFATRKKVFGGGSEGRGDP